MTTQRTYMTLEDAIKMYPDLKKQPVEIVEYPQDDYYPSFAIFQFRGDSNYRTTRINRFDIKAEGK